MPMRIVMLDTETTGLRVEDGHRLIEIGCVECIDRRVTERHFHVYLNPEREIDEGATRVHGMTWDQLRDKPRFADIADDFLEFIAGSTLVIHNAEFDCGFLNAELKRIKRDPIHSMVAEVIDSLGRARDLHPGQRNSLDALCSRYSVANQHRVLHGALLDAQLLAEVYLAMTRGQEALAIHDPEDDQRLDPQVAGQLDLSRLRVVQPSPEELAAHQAVLDEIDRASQGKTIWRAG
jgi:DNA polymerase-3 subunit epsilon